MLFALKERKINRFVSKMRLISQWLTSLLLIDIKCANLSGVTIKPLEPFAQTKTESISFPTSPFNDKSH